MQHMVIIGKADELPVRAEHMHMRTAAQRAGRIRRGNIHRVEVLRNAVFDDHTATVMKIVMPLRIRVFRAMDKNVFFRQRTDGHHAHMRARRCTVNHLNRAGMDVNALNGFAGKRRAGGTHIKRQPLTVRRPGMDIGQLVMARCEGELFHVRDPAT